MRPYALRPYGVVRYDHDAVDVVGHDDERVQFDFGPVGGGTRPFLAGDEAELVQTDRIAFDGSEQTFPVVGANRDEIRPARRVIVAAEADGPAVVFVAVEHYSGRRRGGGRLGTPGRGVTRYAPTGPAAYSNNAFTRPSDVGETAMAVIVMRM